MLFRSEVAEHFDWVHSIDRLKIAQRLSDQRPAHLPPLQVCLQVNISGQASKSGVAPQEALALAQAVNALPRLRLRGLMSIPEPADDEADRRAPHRALRELRDALQRADPGLDLPVLSMGMSDDLEAAIAEGATLVRIGTGNMIAADVMTVCVDIHPAVVQKLSDRGSAQSQGIVTDVGAFLGALAEGLGVR